MEEYKEFIHFGLTSQDINNTSVENYGLLKVTDDGKKFLKHPKSFKIVEDNDFEDVEEEAPARGATALSYRQSSVRTGSDVPHRKAGRGRAA